MILLWGLPEDPCTRAVCTWLTRWDAAPHFVDHAAVARTRVRYTSHPAPAFFLGVAGGPELALDAVRAAYLRPYDYRDYPAFADDGAAGGDARAAAALVHHLMAEWADDAPALVVNRPAAEATNRAKLAQARAIAAAGFATPPSLVTNDPAALREFRARHGRVIYKSMSSVRSVVRELADGDLPGGAAPAGDVPNADTSDDDGAAAAFAPTLFQARVPGRNVRAHVVGGRCIACAVESDAVDYRYAPARLAPASLPPDVERRCVELTARLGLVLAGIDLVVTPGGDWYCLEANPNPGFSYYDACTDGAVGRALADALRGAA